MIKVLFLVIVSALCIEGEKPSTRYFCNVNEDNCIYNPDIGEYEDKGKPCPIPARPSPCGPNAECKLIDSEGTCVCLEKFIGHPPFCRESTCDLNEDCADNFVCIRSTCVNPCTGLCGLNAVCNVYNHVPECNCRKNYFGNAYAECKEEDSKENE